MKPNGETTGSQKVACCKFLSQEVRWALWNTET